MRGREFLMKDAYSFDADEKGAEKSYEKMHDAYQNIFRRCGLRFRAVEADTGTIGGNFSHEFMVLSDTGEDQIVNCTKCQYAANLEKAEVKHLEGAGTKGHGEPAGLEEVETPDKKTIEEVSEFLSITPDTLVKTLIYNVDNYVAAVLVRGDHDLNEAKLKSLLKAEQLEMASQDVVRSITGAPVGFAGPVGLKVKIIADNDVKNMTNFVTGGNRKDLHLRNVNMDRDFKVDLFGDLRVIIASDRCPRCGSEINFGRGIEVGHIFKLGTKYSKAMKAMFLDEQGVEKETVMGCYGIGVSRTVAAAIEQNHDNDGIIFPVPIAPFEVLVLPLQVNEKEVVDAAEKIYKGLMEQGVDVLLDDRDLRAGFKFKDADLLGIPVRVTIGSRELKNGKVEMKLRTESGNTLIPFDESIQIIINKVKELYDSIK